LWSTDLAIDGANPAMRFSHPLADGMGDLYLNPLEPEDQAAKHELKRTGVVLSGGVVKTSRIIELILNQPSWSRSRMISDRINERFPKAPGDRYLTAEPKTDSVIQLNLPGRYAGDAERFLLLMSKLFIQRSPNFEPAKAEQLAELILRQAAHDQTLSPEERTISYEDIGLCWEALGKTTLPTLRRLYANDDLAVRLTALDAGAHLADELATDHLLQLSKHPEVSVRLRTARILSFLPNSLRGPMILRDMLDDPHKSVRIAAYESLSDIRSTFVQRLIVGDAEHSKFVLDMVPSRLPMIYISQSRLPRIVVFNPGTGFKLPMLARLWENSLMLRWAAADQPVAVFYQPPQPTADNPEAKPITLQVAPFVANFIRLLSHKTTDEYPMPGFDMTYSRVVNAVYNLHRQGLIQAEMELEISPLAEAIAKAAEGAPAYRPDTGPAATQPATAPGITPGTSTGTAPAAPPNGRPDTAPTPPSSSAPAAGNPAPNLPPMISP